MKKSELKAIISPIVKECVKESVREMMLESGLLVSVITEVMKGVNNRQVMVEQRQQTKIQENLQEESEVSQLMMRRAKLDKTKNSDLKRELLKEIGKTAYGGVNIFEGINETIPEEIQSKPGNALSGIAPNDPGIDISGLIDPNRAKAILGGRKKSNAS